MKSQLLSISKLAFLNGKSFGSQNSKDVIYEGSSYICGRKPVAVQMLLDCHSNSWSVLGGADGNWFPTENRRPQDPCYVNITRNAWFCINNFTMMIVAPLQFLFYPHPVKVACGKLGF